MQRSAHDALESKYSLESHKSLMQDTIDGLDEELKTTVFVTHKIEWQKKTAEKLLTSVTSDCEKVAKINNELNQHITEASDKSNSSSITAQRLSEENDLLRKEIDKKINAQLLASSEGRDRQAKEEITKM